MREIFLRLNEEEARTLYGYLHDLAEYWAAGAPIAYPPLRVHEQLGVVLTQLRSLLGILSVAEAMARTDAELRQLAGVGLDEPSSMCLGETAPAMVPGYVIAGLDAIRAAGSVDMDDLRHVITEARRLGLDELARWIVLHRALYSQGRVYGFKSDEADDEPAG